MFHKTEAPQAALATLAEAALVRLTLAANHGLAAEPQAVVRLKAHIGCVIDGYGLLPALLPLWVAQAVGPQAMRWLVTPAGLLEWAGMTGSRDGASAGGATLPDASVRLNTASLTVVMRAWAANDSSVFEVQGEAALAADLQWVLENVRWDYAGDLEHVLPPALGATAARVAEAAVAAVQRGVQSLDAWWPRGPSARP